MLKHIQVPVTPFVQNCSIVYCDQSLEAAVIDPGGDIARIQQAANTLGVSIKKIWLTHGHLDHVGGTAELSNALNIDIIGPAEEDSFWLDALDQQSAMFNFPKVESFRVTQWLTQGDVLNLGEETLEVRFTPGHTPGHVVLYSQKSKVVFVGDVLFSGGVGRTDFPMGDHAQLMTSIKEQLFTLPDDVDVVSGHGPITTIGHEKATNPYVQ
jgi:hydroxyacylglutathione hydrolase